MIHSLQISNFQSHKQTKLEFSKGVNAIVGSSDSGKTTIIRAARWLAFNRPSGEAFRSNWGGDTKVTTCIMDESKTIINLERIRTDKKNSYGLLDNSKINQAKEVFFTEFKAIKSEVPIEIQQSLNLNEINLQMQLDGPFLLNESPGKVAEHFNKIAKLDVIDTGIANVKKWIRTINTDISSNESRLEQLEQNLSEYDYLIDLEKEIKRLEKLEQHQLNIEADTDRLDALIRTIRITESEIQKYDKLLKLEDKVDETIILVQQNKGLAVREKELSNFIDKCKRSKKEYQTQAKELKQMEERFTNEFPDVCPLCGRPM